MTVKGNNLEEDENRQEDENRRISHGRAGCIAMVVLIAMSAQQQPGIGGPLVANVAALLLTALAVPFVGGLRQLPRGFRRTPIWPAIGWAALGIVAYCVFGIAYEAVAQPDYEQTRALDLLSPVSVIGTGFAVVCVVPVAEELFFRWVLYGALRTRYSVAVAALVAGLLFGLVHFEGGTDGLLIVPPLAMLGVILCLVRERTASLYPVVAMHSLISASAYAQLVDRGAVASAVFGTLMILACVLVPRFTQPASTRSVR